MIASNTPVGGGVAAGLGGISSSDATFAAMPDVRQAAAALPQQLLRQLLASVPHMQVPLESAGGNCVTRLC